MRVSLPTRAVPVFAILLSASPVLAQRAAPAGPDADMQCAATFIALENSARASGISNGNFGAMATKILQVHRAYHPGEDAASYTSSVNSAAQSLQQAIASGGLGFTALQSQVAICNARYQPAQAAGSAPR